MTDQAERNRKTRFLCLVALLLSVNLSAQEAPSASDAFGMTKEATQVPGDGAQWQGAEMTWKTECVGRVLMSLPEIEPKSWSYGFDDSDMTRLPSPMTRERFWQGVEIMRAGFEKQTHDLAPNRLAWFERQGDNVAFVIYYNNDASFYGPDMLRYIWFDPDHAYELKTRALVTRGAPPSPTLFRPFIEKYSPVLSRIEPLKPGQITNRDGLCIDGAVVSGETGRNAGAGLRVEIHDGVELGFGYGENNYKRELLSNYEELELDQKQANVGLSFVGNPEGFREFKVLRKRERVLAGLAGQEVVTRTTLNTGHVYYDFAWGTRGGSADPYLGGKKSEGGMIEPTITVLLQTSKDAANPSTNKLRQALPPEDQMFKLWDYALSTFRFRPGALPNGQQIRAVN